MDVTLIAKWKESSKTGFARQTDTIIRNYFFGLEYFIESYVKMFNASYNVDEMSISVECGKRSFLVFSERVREFGKKTKKRFSVKPMSTEEAILQMKLLGHSFFVFKNIDTNEMNVVYTRKDGKYALIESVE